MSDPTAFDLNSHENNSDPRVRRIRGRTNHGGYRLNMPFITPVAENLWHGGCEPGLLLPPFIKHVVSLYRWERYEVHHELLSFTEVQMFDATEQGFDQIEQLARWVNLCRESGPVLVHCQAGLNRSSLVVAKALLLAGEVRTGNEAITLMRDARSAAVLCNPAFEEWVSEQVAA